MAVRPPNAESVTDWRRSARARLREAGIDSAAAEADLIAAHVLGMTRLHLTLARHRRLLASERRQLFRLLHRRLDRVPIQYLLRDVDFFGLHLEVRPGVFIPRPETEGLVERVLAFLEPEAQGPVLDVGTGSGAIALAIAALRPRVRIVATDVSSAARQQARRNARRLGLADRLRIVSGDLRRQEGTRFRAVVSNPPYIARRERRSLPPEVAEHEPEEALFAGKNGMAVIEALVPRSAELVESGGLLALEIGADQGDRVARILKSGNWSNVRIERDLAGKERYALAIRR